MILNIVKRLLEVNVELNLQDANGDTALMHAVSNNRLELVDLLLNNGADHSIQNEDGNTALDLATTQGKKDIEVLIRRKTETVYSLKRSVKDKWKQLSYIKKALTILIISGGLAGVTGAVGFTLTRKLLSGAMGMTIDLLKSTP